MSSEAAQKAYPEPYGVTVGVRYKAYAMQKAFDRGAVEALRQAAAQVDTGSEEWVRLMNLAGFWVVGQ